MAIRRHFFMPVALVSFKPEPLLPRDPSPNLPGEIWRRRLPANHPGHGISAAFCRKPLPFLSFLRFVLAWRGAVVTLPPQFGHHSGGFIF
jgi:hypothetical protein